ncbi:MAG: hypothetical protein INQ03_09405 [Candidatus Heimdallarchaeota archaeon]|nr:hypothetical protein [Candidatus Heimdallarchaeota archaeon]
MSDVSDLHKELQLLGYDSDSFVEVSGIKINLSGMEPPLEYIPFNSIQAINPEFLDLSFNDIDVLPEMNLSNLKALNLHTNPRLHQIPTFNLLELHISNTSISELPDIPDLEILSANSMILGIPDLSTFNLRELFLENNGLYEFPDIFHMTNLEILSLEENNIVLDREMVDKITDLELKLLNLIGNPLELDLVSEMMLKEMRLNGTIILGID